MAMLVELDSPNHMASSIMNCMGDQPHETNGASPVDQVYAPIHLHPQREEEEKTHQEDPKGERF